MQVTINISVPNPTRGCSSIHFCTEHDEILSPTQARVQETPWSFSLTASKLPYAEGSPPPIRVGMAVPALGRRSAFLDRSSSGKWESAKMGAIIFFCFARPRGRNSPGRGRPRPPQIHSSSSPPRCSFDSFSLSPSHQPVRNVVAWAASACPNL